MQLKKCVLPGLLALLAGSAAASGQSLSPMRQDGADAQRRQGFPADRRQSVQDPHDLHRSSRWTPSFKVPVDQAVVNFPDIRLAPGASRPVIVQFRIGPDLKERTIGVCIAPEGLEGPILPRVCGTYTGRRASARG